MASSNGGARRKKSDEPVMSPGPSSPTVARAFSRGRGGEKSRLVSGRPSTRVLRSRTGSTPDSPRSLDPKARLSGSPLRPPRQATPNSETEDSSLRLDRGTYQYMYQDIVNIKTMLLKLKRVLQEAETLNPFDGSMKNGLFYTLASTEATANEGDGSIGQSPQEEVVDLRRQVVFLQQQLDEKERTIQLLQVQMTKYTNSETDNSSTGATANATTQTERLQDREGRVCIQCGRWFWCFDVGSHEFAMLLTPTPGLSFTCLLFPLNALSLTDAWDRRKQPTAAEPGMNRRPTANCSKGKGIWKQRPSSELVAAVSKPEMSGIPTRRYSAVSTSCTLPRRSHIGSNSLAS
ncbi:hypothetical protein C0J52_26939 [Blattella germanica]|nr:hypothetical protein C0J52_26939 [Blattella germanica]